MLADDIGVGRIRKHMNEHNQEPRIRQISGAPEPHNGTCVVYVMSRDQRCKHNHALHAAQLHAIKRNVPLLVVFTLYRTSHTRSLEHATFMLEGLEETAKELQVRGIPFIVQLGVVESLKTLRQLRPCAIYTDMNPLRSAKGRVEQLCQLGIAPVYLVDTHNIVPVWVTSDKQEYAARTIRTKIHRLLPDYLGPVPELASQKYPSHLLTTIPARAPIAYVPELEYAHCGIKHGFTPGEAAAHRTLDSFIQSRLPGYSVRRNDPSLRGLSELSPYLHFGHICSLEVVLRVQAATQADSTLQKDADALIEEIVIRKELSDNYCYYNDTYDSLGGAPDWAYTTLQKHANDPREYVYTKDQFEQAKTHDDAWNAAQLQLITTGKMHGYMRMYWAKKVLEWSESPKEAHRVLCYLNDFYSLDGGDPNGYVGILWSVAGLHDRPWQERPVYGTVRSMVYKGLQRKFDVQTYIDKYTNK